ncbi:hypothetical protein V8C86DRAFT_2686915 [Haematococcus lacustris]
MLVVLLLLFVSWVSRIVGCMLLARGLSHGRVVGVRIGPETSSAASCTTCLYPGADLTTSCISSVNDESCCGTYCQNLEVYVKSAECLAMTTRGGRIGYMHRYHS